jgi:protein O-GlcNAc transferase
MTWFSKGEPRAESLKQLGNERRAAGDLEGAIESYRRALQLEPHHVASLYNLGLVLRETKRLEEAERCFRRVCELEPRDADALLHLASLLDARSSVAEAAIAYRKVVALDAGNAGAWLCLGAICVETSTEEAIRCLETCLRLEPETASAHHHLGRALKKLGRAERAAGAYRRALELAPASETHNDLGNLLLDEGRLAEAAGHYREALGLWPENALTHNNLGCALSRMEKFDEAAAALQRAVALDPAYADAHLNLGSVQRLRGAREQALACFRRALELRPQDAGIRECLLTELQTVCEWDQLASFANLQRRAALDPAQHVTPFSLLSIPSTAAEQLQCARNYAARYEWSLAAQRERLNFRFERGTERRIRIGYLSADFHDHVTAYVMAEMFELHDRQRFEVAAYSYGPDDGSAMRARLKAAFDRFVDGRAMSHAELATAIHADRVDILVDLKGYTQHSRVEVAALRPAPVQVAYMGYPGTLAAGFIDYLVADRYVVPPGQEKHYGEALALLPGTYYVNDRKRASTPTPPRADLQLPQQGFVFCCFNQTYKILPEVFDVWMRLLGAMPRSVLWLLEANPAAKQNLAREARRRGIDPGRLVFAPRVPAERHLGRMAAADLFLDTRPYNAHTTATDALWAGVPVVTCPGDTFAARVAGSLLSAMGLPELITASMADYEALALRLARSPQELAGLRARLLRDRDSAALFDTPGFVRNLEKAYERMWARYRAGEAPARIEI